MVTEQGDRRTGRYLPQASAAAAHDSRSAHPRDTMYMVLADGGKAGASQVADTAGRAAPAPMTWQGCMRVWTCGSGAASIGEDGCDPPQSCYPDSDGYILNISSDHQQH